MNITKKKVERRKNKMVDLIVKSKIKAAVPDLSVSGDVPEALNKKVLKLLDEAATRAKLNGRRTLQARDL
jgi:histone H3/H4